MPKGERTKKKTATRKPAGKALSRKTGAKKPALKKTAKKKAIKKKALKKTAAKKTAVAGKKASRKSVKKAAKKVVRTKAEAPSKTVSYPEIPVKPLMVEPGPPAGNIPPVEEPARNEEAIGTVTHYYSHLGVAVIQINTGTLRTGDAIHITGHSTDFSQRIESMEYEHQHVDEASAGQSVGIKVTDHAREHDIVYLVK